MTLPRCEGGASGELQCCRERALLGPTGLTSPASNLHTGQRALWGERPAAPRTTSKLTTIESATHCGGEQRHTASASRGAAGGPGPSAARTCQPTLVLSPARVQLRSLRDQPVVRLTDVDQLLISQLLAHVAPAG